MSDHDHPLYAVKLLAALRSGDPALIHPFLTEIGKDRRNSTDSSKTALDTGAAALHLAVRCGAVQTVSLLLSHRAISPNGVHPPGSGITPLHLAASLGRVDIVNLLLEQEGIDDTVRDGNGRRCRDVAKGHEVLKAIDDSRSILNATYRSLLRIYTLSAYSEPAPPTLIQLLESPRIGWVDLAYLDDSSGSSLLHEAAKRKDLRLIELAIRAGADVFVRDRRGKMVYESAGKDDKVKVFLRQFANRDRTLIQPVVPSTEPPLLKGYLNKYTNVARGYGTRWFVLNAGVLSYYRHQEDESLVSRGSVRMNNCIIKSIDKYKFEIHSLPSRGHTSVQKWYLRANHPVEASRWIQALSQCIEWYKEDIRRPSVDSEANTSINSNSSKHPVTAVRKSMRTNSTFTEGGESVNTTFSENVVSPLEEAVGNLNGNGNDNREDVEQDGEDDDDSSADSTTRQPPYESNFELHANTTSAQLDLTNQLLGNLVLGRGGEGGGDGSGLSMEGKTALQESLNSVLDLFNDYVTMVRDREEWYKKQLTKERARQSVWEESLATVVKEGAELEQELRARSRKRGSRVFGPSVSNAYDGFGSLRRGGSIIRRDREGTITATSTLRSPPRTVLETEEPNTPTGSEQQQPPSMIESGATTTIQADNKRTKPSRNNTVDTVTSTSTAVTVAPANFVASPEGKVLSEGEEEEEVYDTDEEDEFFDAIESNNIPNLVVPVSLTSPTLEDIPSYVTLDPYIGHKELRKRLQLTDERPPTSLWSVLKHSIGKDLTRISFPVFFNEPTSMLQRMAEDMEFSECLDTAATQRDQFKRLAFVAAFAMSNYSSTIGRIAKPFNPMLSETFEYVRLDKQYRYVSEQVSHHPPISACWAESPLWHYYGEVDAQNKFMGKSFEIRPTGVAHTDLLIPEEWVGVEDLNQIPNRNQTLLSSSSSSYSHTSSASTVNSNSASTSTSTSASATSTKYQKAPGVRGKGKVVEHYTWKKVTTNVSGFILGSPTIDHYGDMVVTNHRTGDQCVLTFKPRGWRGKDAFEISGVVMDKNGKAVWEIAGRWNSQLIGRKIEDEERFDGGGRGGGGGGGGGKGKDGGLHPDLRVSGSGSGSGSSFGFGFGSGGSQGQSQDHHGHTEYILLWKNSEKPPGMPFNLTPFAISLNNCPKETLRPYLAPTDCRLRPDQRAFELGMYDLANTLKQKQEEKQRGIRKERELGRLEQHKPRWFRAETDGDTGDRVWVPLRVKVKVKAPIGEDEKEKENVQVVEEERVEYWVERERVFEVGGKEKMEWKDVDDIFIEEPQEMKGRW